MTRQQQLGKLILAVIEANNDTESDGSDKKYAAACHDLAWYIIAQGKRVSIRSGP